MNPPRVTAARASALPLGLRSARLCISALWGHDIFISYSRVQSRYATKLWKQLEASRLIVAFDQADFNPGDGLTAVMRFRVRRSRYLLLLDSPDAQGSRYVREEVESALCTRRHLMRVRLLTTFEQSNSAPMEPEVFRRAFVDDIWLPEPADPSCDAPASSVVEGVLKLHRTRRVRTLFWRSVVLAGLVLIASIVAFFVSREAPRRPLDAISTFRSGESFDSASEAARRVFDTWFFPMWDTFASLEHWQLRDVTLRTFLKRRSDSSVSAVRARAECSGKADTDGVCAWMSADGASWVMGRHAKGGGCDAFVVYRGDIRRALDDVPGLISHDPARRVAIGRSLMAFAIGNRVFVSRISASPSSPFSGNSDPGPLTGSLGGLIEDMSFSDAEDRLLVLRFADQGVSSRLELSVLDSRTLGVLDQEAVPTQQPPAPGSRYCDDLPDRARVTVDGRLALVTVGHERFGFELGGGTFAPLDRPSAGKATGAVFGPGGRVLVWTNSGAVALCVLESMPAMRTAASPCEDIEIDPVHAITGATIVAADQLRMRDDTGRCWESRRTTTWLAPQPASTCPHDEQMPGEIARSASGEETVIRTADGAIEWTRLPGQRLVGEGLLWGTVLAATLAPHGGLIAVSTGGATGNLLQLGDIESWRQVVRWRTVHTLGPALALTIHEASNEVLALESLNGRPILRAYPITASATAQMLRAMGPHNEK